MFINSVLIKVSAYLLRCNKRNKMLLYLSQAFFAELLNISINTLKDYEIGRYLTLSTTAALSINVWPKTMLIYLLV